MKKYAFLSIFFSCLFLFSGAFFSCSNLETETGEKSDSDSVSLSVDSFGSAASARSISTGGIYCSRNVIFSGKIKNASEIKGVWAQERRPGEDFFTDLKKAAVQGEKWTCSLTFEKDDFFFIRFVAIDSRGKTLATDSTIIPVFIKNNAEEDSLWYIDRGSGTEYVSLLSKNELEAMDFSLPQNKDYAQNSSFKLRINSDGEEPVKYSGIQIRDSDDNKICEISNSGKSDSEPCFEVSEKLLASCDDSLSTGRHYLKVCYTAVDLEIDAGYFLWWPESDLPKVSLAARDEKSESFTLHTGEKFSVTIFDDDFLGRFFCALLTEEEYKVLSDKMQSIKENAEDFIRAATEEAGEERIKYSTDKDKVREVELSFTSEESPQTMHLVSLVWDSSLAHNFSFSDTKIPVIDGNVSAVIVESPKSGEVPCAQLSSDGSKAFVTVTGTTVDALGCKSLQFVWVSGDCEDSEKAAKAKKWLEKLDKESVSNSDESADFKLWNAILSSPKIADDFQYQSFRFKIDLLNDFGQERASEKFFLIKHTRNDGKISYSEYRLSQDNEKPAVSHINVEVKKEGSSGKTFILAEVKTNKKVQSSGSPFFELLISEKQQSLLLPLTTCEEKLLIFKKEIIAGSSAIPNGKVSYNSSGCIKKISSITDGAGTSLEPLTGDQVVDTGIVIDTIAPKVVAMMPEGESAKGSNIFTEGNKITLEFSEKVEKAHGKIILRQTAGWAIPPVLSEETFGRIMEKLDETDREILARQENGSNMEDSENILGSSSKYPNDTYHGTGQHVGPYKKTVQGLVLSENGDFLPDLSAKYVLDFDIDIWETDTPHYFNRTFESGLASQQSYARRGYESLTNMLKVISPKKTVRTAGQIRSVLQKIHYHERIISVDSDKAELSEDGKKLSLTFTKGLFDESDDLPQGREWELVIEKGAFKDVNGNEFGLLQGGKEIIIKNSNKKASFWSDKVARPFVRLDRYSYGLGIWQSDSSGNRASQIMADKTNYLPQSHDSVKPTGYVRARIDCETKGAKIKYTIKEHSKPARFSNPPSDDEPLYVDRKDSIFYSYYTETENLKASELLLTKKYDEVSAPEDGKTVSPVFAVGSGSYKTSFKDYVIVVAEKPGFESSAQEVEGVFQTVVQFVNPKTKNGSSATSPTIGQKDLSIHGIMLDQDEPYISPFPLRQSQNGSPYLRRCYRENTDRERASSLDYYWVSYEILSDASFSFYNWNATSYDWAENSGLMKAGEFTRFISE